MCGILKLVTQAVKYPHKAYWYLQLLVGLNYDNPLVQQYKKWFSYYNNRLKDEERGEFQSLF